ncbi:MAG: LAGLIDADG family homing endonuclease, partial [Acidobacteriota bacterium]
MFRLEKLEISGFKSFADRTTLLFGEGITAVVGPNGCGKCVDGNTLVTLADGRDVPIRELVEAALKDSNVVETLDDGLLTRENPHIIEILSLNPATLRLEPRLVTAFIKRETTPQLLRIRTRSGREVTATPYHPLFTLENGRLRTLWAEELKPGVRLALPRRLPVRSGEVDLSPQAVLERFRDDDNIYVPYSESLRAWADEGREKFGQWSKWAEAAQIPAIRLKGLLDRQAIGTDSLLKLARAAEVMPPFDGRLKSHGSGQIKLPSSFTPDLARFLGLLVAEGRNTNSNQVWFVNADPLVNDEYERLANNLFGVHVHRLHYKPRAEDGLIFSRALGKTLERLFDFPINSSSSEKEIPAQLFEAEEETQWAFLSGLFEGDAYICVRPQAGKANPLAYVEFVSASEKLARQVISLLMRLGIFASLRVKQQYASNTVEKRRRNYYAVLIYGTKQLRYVARRLSFIGEKKNALEAMRQLTTASNPNRDLVPSVTPIVKEAAHLAGVKIKASRRDNPKLAAYVEGRCEASRVGLLETIDAIKRLGATPERAGEHLDRLSLLAKSDIYWDEIISVEEVEPQEEWVYDLSIAETHNFVAGNIIVHNSNISDSISWVLGEQSAKNLRGAKMEDVIFNGTRDRKPTGMAEVLLTLVAVEDIHEHDQSDPAEEDESRFDQAVENAERAADTARALVEEMTEKEPTVETQPEAQSPAPEAGEAQQRSNDENAPASASVDQNNAATLTVDGDAGQTEEQKTHAKRHRSPHMRRRKKIVISAGERITIGRRLYRTGESDYLMNGRPCLLRDIQDLFAGTGLGGAHYAIIEQGRIGQILSSKPLDRRALIEEAAGITKFKSRKRAAELKLESAKQNLTRLNDIISEVERQVNSLKRQAQKARRYRRLREELRGLQKVVFAADYFRLNEANDHIAAELEEAARLQLELDQQLAERESEHQAVSSQAREIEDRLTALREQAASIELEADRARNRRAFEQQQIEEMTARIQELERDQTAMQERLSLLDAEAEQRGLDLKAIESELTAEQSLLLAREGEYQSALAKLREAEQEIERLRQQTFVEIGRLERLRNLKANIEDSLRKLELKQASLNTEQERALARLEEASSQYAQASGEAEESHTRLADLTNSIAQRAASIEELRARCSDLRLQLDATHSERAAGEHRLASLEDLDAHHAYYSDAVQYVLSPEQAARINALGALADFVEVEAQYERLVESLMGRELQSVLVPTIDDALAGVESIRSEELGRGAFLVVGLHGGEGEPEFKPENDFIETESDRRDEEIRPMPNPSFISESAQPFELEVLRAIDLLGLRTEIKAIVERAFPDKCNAAVVPDIEAALQLSIENPLRVYVTYEGEQVVNGRLIVTASHTKGTSLLGLKREIKQLRVQTALLREDEENQSAEIAQLESRLAELENETGTLDRELRQQEKDSAARDTQLESLARDLDRARQHVRVVEAELEQAAQEQAEMQSRIEEMAGELESAEAMEREV